MTATTTLPLFWHLSSANKGERIDASVKLVSALQQFQDRHILETRQKEDSTSDKEVEFGGEESGDSEAKENDDEFKACSARLDADNATDVAYAIRRLIRGLASPRESSRLGFTVALTELLSRIDTITCGQFLTLLNNSSQTTGSMSGQEERDMLFARLFGLKCAMQSGLLFSQKPLKSSSTSSGSLKDFERFLTELLSLGNKKSWLRESCWWTLLAAVDVLSVSDMPWKDDAYAMLLDRVYLNDKSWSPEKVALTLKLQKTRPTADWKAFCGPYFKNAEILSNANLTSLARLLKDSAAEDFSEEEASKHSAGPWKPQLHFVWDMIFDTLLSSEGLSKSSGKFQDFYRIVVDESLFASSSSPQRKFWGFLVFQKTLRRLPPSHLPMLFTKNFMRTWINQLSKNDRYLHKIARQVASDVQHIVEKDPKSGLTLVLQLTGTNGSFHFDRITKTKTVENVIANMDTAGIEEYVTYLLKQVNEGENDSFTSVDSRRSWVIDQLTMLLRKGSIPKSDESLRIILNWLTTHAFFKVVKKSSKSSNAALHLVPEPPLSDDLRSTCRSKLLSCLGDLTNMVTAVESKSDGKTGNVPGAASDGEFWISKVLKTIVALEKDTKHVVAFYQLDDQKLETRNRVFSTTQKITATSENQESARGVELLLTALAIKCLFDDEHEADWEGLQECIEVSKRLLAPTQTDGKKEKKKESKVEQGDEDADRAPIDLVVDTIIGLLEHSTNFTRVVANQSFDMLTPLVNESSVDLILTQLETRDPTEEALNDDEDMDTETGESEQEDSEDNGEEKSDHDSSDAEDKELNNEDTEVLQKALEAAVSGKDAGSAGSDSDDSSDEASMDDEQMMAIDDKLAEVFRSRTEGRKKGKVGAQREATYFKNRVLDLVEIYMKKQPSNTLVFRFIRPLVELIATSSSDEKQLSDKAKGVLRSRLSKIKDVPAINDPSQAVELLEFLHIRARKAHSQEIVTTINLCSLYVTKALVVVDEQSVLRIYKDSITDFITRKASSLNLAFILNFIRRHPVPAWNIRTHVTDTLENAINGYRHIQAFKLVQAVLTSLPQPESKKTDIISFAEVLSTKFLDVLSKSCSAEKPLMSSAHMKESLDVALQLCRYSKRFATDPKMLEATWVPKKWDELASALSSSEHFKASTSLLKTCRQIVRLAQADNSDQSVLRKRKQDTDGNGNGEDESIRRKPKRKKVRKSPKGNTA